MRISSLVLFLMPGALLIGGGYAAAQSLQFENYTAAEGLPSDRVNDIILDNRGFLWCATQNGLARFDGFNFHTCAPEDGRTLNVKAVLQDRRGNIWIGTDGSGLFRYDGQSFQQYTREDGLASDNVMDVFEDSRGSIWAACWRGGISKLDGDTLTTFDHRHGVPDSRVWVIQEDNQGHMWFGTLDGLFQQTATGMRELELPEDETSSPNAVTRIHQDRNGNYWIALQRKGLLRYDGSGFQRFDQREGLAGTHIKAICEDADGYLWFGCAGFGMSRYNGEAEIRYTDRNGLRGSVVTAVAEDRTGQLWIYTRPGGLYCFDADSCRSMKRRYVERAYGTIVHCDSQGRIWIGTRWAGIRMLEKGREYAYTKNQGLCSNQIFTMMEDNNGTFWFGTDDGIIQYNGTRWINHALVDGLPIGCIQAIGKDRDGYVWFGGPGNGIIRYKNGTFSRFTHTKLDSSNVYCMETDADGNLWILSNRGVFRFDGSGSHQYLRTDGLPSDVCTFIIAGKQRVFIGSGDGLSQWDAPHEAFTPVAMSNRIFVSTIYPTATIEDRNGNLWLGSESGLFKISPDKLRQRLEPPRVQFTEFLVHGNNVRDLHAVEIPFEQNHLELGYIGLNFSDPAGVLYRYTIEGFDSQWHETSNRTLSFPDLAPGDYTLHVQARYRRGSWSEPATVSFSVLPPFWATLWFRILAGMLGLAAVGFVHIARTRRMTGRNRELEDEVQKRTASLIVQQNILAGRERTIRALMNASSDAAALVDVQGHFLDMNDVMAARFHRSPDELLGVNSFTLMPPELLLTRYRIFQSVLETGVYRQFEDSRDGLMLQNIFYPIKGIIGNTASVAVFSRDITEERAAECELLTREKRYRTLIETIPYGVAEINNQGRITFSNAVHCAIFRCTKDQMIGASLWDLLDDPAEQQALRNYLQFLVREQPAPAQYAGKCRRFDGTVFDVLADWNYQRDENGRVNGFIAIMADVTERNRLEAERVAYQEKLRAMASELSMTEERERKKIAVDLHDSVGQYLSLAKLRLSTMLNRHNPTDLQATLIEVQKNLSAAIQETRSLSFELSPPTLHQFGLEAAVEWLLDDIHAKHQLAVKIEQNIENCEIDSDIRSELFRDVRELVNNIIKHAKATAVRVEMRVHQAVITIVVTDNGCGFDLEQTAQRRTRHSYGLFSIRERLTALGGTFELETAVGKGTVATIIAPICKCTPATQG